MGHIGETMYNNDKTLCIVKSGGMPLLGKMWADAYVKNHFVEGVGTY